MVYEGLKKYTKEAEIHFLLVLWGTIRCKTLSLLSFLAQVIDMCCYISLEPFAEL